MLQQDVIIHHYNNILEQLVHMLQGFRLDIKVFVGKFNRYKGYQDSTLKVVILVVRLVMQHTLRLLRHLRQLLRLLRLLLLYHQLQQLLRNHKFGIIYITVQQEESKLQHHSLMVRLLLTKELFMEVAYSSM